MDSRLHGNDERIVFPAKAGIHNAVRIRRIDFRYTEMTIIPDSSASAQD